MASPASSPSPYLVASLEPHQQRALEQLAKLGEQRVKHGFSFFFSDNGNNHEDFLAQPPFKRTRVEPEISSHSAFQLCDQDGLIQFTPPESPELGEDFLDFSDSFYSPEEDDIYSTTTSLPPTVPASPAPMTKDVKESAQQSMITPPLSPDHNEDSEPVDEQEFQDHQQEDGLEQDPNLGSWPHLFSPTIVALLTMLSFEDDASNPEDKAKRSDYTKGVRHLVELYGREFCLSLDANGYGVAHYAAFEGSVDTLRYLSEEIGREALEMEDSFGNLPLYWGVRGNQEQAVACLIELGASIHSKNLANISPCKFAVEMNSTKILDIMLQADANQVFEQEEDTGLSLLHIACAAGLLETAEVLVRHGASPSLKDSNGTTPLISAVSLGHNALLETLLRDRNAVSVSDKQGRTALHWAAAVGNCEAAKILVKSGAKLEMRDRRGRTPLLIAALAGHRDVIDFLLSRKASTNVEDYEGVVMPPIRRLI